MDPADGEGRGRMWLVFTPSEERHPTAETYTSASSFAGAYSRLGVADLGQAQAGDGPDTKGADCEPQRSLEYFYVVR